MPSAVDIHHGDCREVLARMAGEGLQVDSVVTDPPYHLTSIVKRFWSEGAAPAKSNGATGAYERATRGFMGKTWDGGAVAFEPETWRAVFAVMKPGAHLVAFGGTRTYHRMVCAIEDAGFEIRDGILDLIASDDAAARFMASLDPEQLAAFCRCIEESMFGGQLAWLYGSGFPKSHNNPAGMTGWGTALKPAWEPICLARKPLIGTVAANVLKHGTGALNIDACRVPGIKPQVTQGINLNATSFNVARERRISGDPHDGRWPANVIHDGSDEVIAALAGTEDKARPGARTMGADDFAAGASERVYSGGWSGHKRNRIERHFDDSGSAARFFYSAKADAGDRLGSKHPTVKPVDLIAYLTRLITPPGGVVLDPFAGSGTTGMAAMREGFRAVLIEREAEYVADIRRRLEHVSGADAALFAQPPRNP